MDKISLPHQLPDGQIEIIKEGMNMLVIPFNDLGNEEVVAYLLGSYLVRAQMLLREHRAHGNCPLCFFHEPIVRTILEQQQRFVNRMTGQ